MEVGTATQSNAQPLVATRQQRILWISPNLPHPDRDGGDLRRWQMITALSERGAAVSLWSEMGHDSGRYGRALKEAGVAWLAPPPVARDRDGTGSTAAAVRELATTGSWDAVIVSYAYLAARHLEAVRREAPGTPVLIDLGNARFHESTASETREEHANAGELELYGMADGLITVSKADTAFLLTALPGVPGYTFAPLAPEPPPIPRSSPNGPLVFWGNMAHHSNANAVGWWMEEIAGEVTSRHRAPIPLQLRGAGAEVYRSVWGASDKLQVGVPGDTIDGARTVLLPLRHGSETAATALSAASKGIPVVATSAAVAGLDPTIRAHICLGETAEQLAKLVVELMTDEEMWKRRRDHLFAAAGSEVKRRGALEQEFSDWMARRRPIRAVAHPDAS
ncbi:MAG: hypothetical protein V3S60_08440 [Acidimicrobiia bacterium]